RRTRWPHRGNDADRWRRLFHYLLHRIHAGQALIRSNKIMIDIYRVSKWYGSFQVLTDCSTQIAKGEVVVVCGPSGSGKSTLIKTVNGLEPFRTGKISVDGISVNA